MFQGNFTILRNPETGNLDGHFQADTPKGPFVMDLSVPAEKLAGDPRLSTNILVGEMLNGASYFGLPQLIGGKSTMFAKHLYRAMKSTDQKKRAGALREYEKIITSAKKGDTNAQDIAYAIKRLHSAEVMGERYKTGRVYNPRSLAVINGDGLISRLRREVKKSPTAIAGVALYNAVNRKDPRAARVLKKLKARAKSGDKRATRILGYALLREKAQKAVKRQDQLSQDPTLMGGFDFGNFMKDVGKVAGPVMKALAPVAKFVPFVGPILEPAMNIVSDAIAEKPEAKAQVARINTLANAGVPRAIRAKTAIQVAQKIQKAKIITDGIKAGAIKPDSVERKEQLSLGKKTAAAESIRRHLMKLFPRIAEKHNLMVIESMKNRKPGHYSAPR